MSGPRRSASVPALRRVPRSLREFVAVPSAQAARPRLARTADVTGARRMWAAHPRIALALKAAAAAALAWLLVQPLGGIADDYPYYAPFGAVIAVSSTVIRSLRSTAQAAAAITIGAATALIARELPLPEVTAVAVVVATGTLLAGWPRLGAMGSWVPVSALFILIIGDRDPVHYVAAYLGLTLAGALLGVAVNMTFPTLPLTPTRIALRRLRTDLAEQLDEVADALRQPEPPTLQEWSQRRRRFRPHIDEMRALAAETDEARRANWRARRWIADTQRQHALAVALEELTALLNQVVTLIVERERRDASEVALGATLRPLTAQALAATARLLRSLDDPAARDDASQHTRAAIDALRGATRNAWHDAGEDRFTAAAIVTALERATSGLIERGASVRR